MRGAVQGAAIAPVILLVFLAGLCGPRLSLAAGESLPLGPRTAMFRATPEPLLTRG